MECFECGFILNSMAQSYCPKCDSYMHADNVDELYFIDVAHRGEDGIMALAKIEAGIDRALWHRFKGLRIVHGYGSQKGHTSHLKRQVVDYLKRYAKDNSCRVVSVNYNQGQRILYF